MAENLKHRRIVASHHSVYGLWWTWTLSVGFLTAVMSLLVVIPKLWLPLFAFILYLVLRYIARRVKPSEGRPVCSLILMTTSRILFISAVIMVAINLCHTRWLRDLMLDPGVYNPEIPYISSLIVSPVILVCTLVALIIRQPMSCRNCVLGHMREATCSVDIFQRESRYQLKMLACFGAFLTIVSWTYYFVYYINVNLNTPDLLMFRWLPLVLYVITVLVFGFRYLSLWSYFHHEIQTNRSLHGNSSLVRYLIICGDKLLAGGERLDTPAQTYIPKRDRLSDYDAATYLRSMSGIVDMKLRFMYKCLNLNTDSNEFHYACFVSDETASGTMSLDGRWYTMAQLTRKDAKHEVSKELSAELIRIYRTVMAWKTYDRNGRRLYPVKHYKPTFRLEDFVKWDVDLDDLHWLMVAENNEDSRFFTFRKLWNKVMHGI